MSWNSNYVDDVPVKISEKYKPLPEISLPKKIAQCLQKCSQSSDSSFYDFSLEKKIISKTLEWKSIQMKERNDRQERIRLREQERLRRIEEEQKHKLNQVSYPSADDLNSTSDEETETTLTTIIQPQVESKPQHFNSILVPTVIMYESSDKNSYVQGNSNGKTNNRTHQKKHSSGKIDFSYFETANSNPFDNMELKTMNEMDILAEILKPNVSEANLERDNSSESDSDKTVNSNSNKESDSQPTMVQQQQPQLQEQQQQQQQQQNYNYYNYGHYPNNYYYQQQQQQQQNYQQYYPNTNQPTTYASQYNYQLASSNYPQNISNNNNNNNTIISDNTTTTKNYGIPYNYQQVTPTQPKMMDEEQVSSKSRSVPDIVKELNDELNNCEKRRVRNNSQTVYSQKNNDKDVARQSNVVAGSQCNELEKDFCKLSTSSQNLVKNISSMGFSREIVSRCVQKLGPDEKVIIEHLIPLSELLDLGFEESTISDALIKFNNNKDKALDYLIS